MAAGTSVYDYTEGASAIDIDDAVAQRSHARRDSLYGGPDDADGAMFDGPGHTTVPTSASRMSYTERGITIRRSSEWSRRRRRSEDGSVSGSLSGRAQGKRRMSTESRASAVNGAESAAEEESELLLGRRLGRSPSPTMNRSSVFENIAQLFGRGGGESLSRRASISSSVSPSRRSRRSRLSDAGSDYALDSEDEGDERWGYSSGEGDDSAESHVSRISSEVDFGSDPPSPTGPSSHLPLFSSDPIFGDEVRIEIDAPLESLNPPPPGPPSRQTIYVADEDSTLRFVGYEVILWRQWLWRALCVLTLGMLALLGHWLPRVWLRWVVREKAFKDLKHGFVVIEVCAGPASNPLACHHVPVSTQRYNTISRQTDHIPLRAVDCLS
jgi:cation-transporting ATPase 13A2